MSDGHTPPDEPERRQPGRGSLLLGGGLVLVLLAAVGATAGWLLADPVDPAVPSAIGSPAAAPSTSSTRATGAAPTRPAADRPTTAPTSASPSRPSGDQTVPDVVGVDFEKARDELRDRKLGWRLVFGTGSGREVVRTSPAPNTPVTRGTTVQVYVAGPAPEVKVPDLDDEDCADVAEELGERGLYPRYPTGRVGTVSAQDPPAGSAARWNDPVSVTCTPEQG
ncbi:PASTA domain-containing protein [Micromonospora sp. KC723]|uniref:PASTA domain-containing protein n=1 Tax=Micromonospora sp. KC723 TaxID=2530381 RepID=UPI00104F7DF9|nr:PASTA domain-containing protein [Micromonospora sp. KC723]TDB69446.1 PASTA domain-containing protein [Micromonospora sp. KC723]